MAQIINTLQGNYVICKPEMGQISTEKDILDLMGLFVEAGTYLLLISEGALHPGFYDLSTRIAGEISLKLSAYRVRTAIVVDLESIPSQPFKDWAGECNRGKELRFCADRAEAEDWLLYQIR